MGLREINLDNPYLDIDLSDMNQAQLIGQIMRLLKRNTELEEFMDDAFMVSPNIDLDIERMKRYYAIKRSYTQP